MEGLIPTPDINQITTFVYQFASSGVALNGMLVIIAGYFGTLAFRKASREKVIQLNAEISRLEEQRNKTIREMLAEARAENQILQQKLDRIEAMVDDIETQRDQALADKVKLVQDNDKLRQREHELEAQILALQLQIKDMGHVGGN